ncbi:hypothetical protein LIER_24772 [Lithospermum erythrorhizon]|uniref:Uncharacterized protein n=1 Tax=Lithospermum erythrorhizon TaxID=34254 RepID=A0AAV3R2E3_LITER
MVSHPDCCGVGKQWEHTDTEASSEPIKWSWSFLRGNLILMSHLLLVLTLQCQTIIGEEISSLHKDRTCVQARRPSRSKVVFCNVLSKKKEDFSPSKDYDFKSRSKRKRYLLATVKESNTQEAERTT